ncbi:hypothetical protein Tco_0858679 [Tanacetum coccineum]|uniref:Reverse transcriptase Ty1/copia-type domain-containing protein n=1 Tax=Tanacetum coccineum TaxID=301880 RepID=A0ABQ5BD48_9ASTR
MDSSFDFEAFSDSNYAGASLNRKSITGGCQFLGKRLISWQCKKQTIVANSTTEAGIHIDNESTICIVKNLVFHSKTKHIEIRHHFIRDSYEKKLIQVIKIHTDHNVVDLLTKAFDVSEMRLSIRSGRPEWEWATTTASRSRGGQWLNLLLPVLVYAARHSLTTVRHKLMLPGITSYCWVIISETSIRSDLKLDDAEGTNCLPTATIFAELERIWYENLTQKLTFYKAYFSSQWKFLIHTILQCLSAKTTSWNEFSSTMASVIICLAINQKFNIFDNMVKNLDGGVKILMYLRFVEVFLDKQVEGMSKHKRVCVTPSHTKKVFANINRPCKGFSGRVTPLFSTMMVQATEDIDAKSRIGCDGEIDDMLRIRLLTARLDKEIFTYVAWIRAFNINEPIYAELCHEFYSTYEFDEVCADDELQTKKIIKFRLDGRAHSLTLLEFARRLGLYQAVELEEEGFNIYFERGLHSDEHFNAQDYWTTGYDKVQKNDLWLLSMFDSRHQNGYANVAWLIARWMKRKGAGTQKESQICYRQFISKIARKCRVLTEDVVRSLSGLIYCRDDTTTLRDLINFEGKLIPEDPQPGVPRVGIPRPSRACMQDLYDRMGWMEICQEAIERIEYRQSYH